MSGPGLVNPYAAVPAPGAAHPGPHARRVRGAVVAVLAGTSAVAGSGVAHAVEPTSSGVPGKDHDWTWSCNDGYEFTTDVSPDRVDIYNVNGSLTRCGVLEPGDIEGEEAVVPEHLPGTSVEALEGSGTWVCDPMPTPEEAGFRDGSPASRPTENGGSPSLVIADDARGDDHLCRGQNDLLPPEPQVPYDPNRETGVPPEPVVVQPRPVVPAPEPVAHGAEPSRSGLPGPDHDWSWRCADLIEHSMDLRRDRVEFVNSDRSTTRCWPDETGAASERPGLADFVRGTPVEVLEDGGDWVCARVPTPRETGVPAGPPGRGQASGDGSGLFVMADDADGVDHVCRSQDELLYSPERLPEPLPERPGPEPRPEPVVVPSPPVRGQVGRDDDRSWQCDDAWFLTQDWRPGRVDIPNSDGSTTRCDLVPPGAGEEGEEVVGDVPEFLPGVAAEDLEDGGEWVCEPTPAAAAEVARALSVVIADDGNGVDNLCRSQDGLPSESESRPEPAVEPEPVRGPSGPDDDRGWRCVDVPGGSRGDAEGVVVVENEDGSSTRCATGDDVPVWLEDVPETDFLPGVEVEDLTDDGDWACAAVPEVGLRAMSASEIGTVVVDDEFGNDTLCRSQDATEPDEVPPAPEPTERERPQLVPDDERAVEMAEIEAAMTELWQAEGPGRPSPALAGSR